MYEVVKKGTEYDYFTQEIINEFYKAIATQINSFLKEDHKRKPVITGCLILEKVPVINMGKKSVFIEFNAKMLPVGFVDAGVHNIIFFDEIPDIVLDRYNLLKGIKLENSET